MKHSPNRTEKGQSMAEFTLIAPVLILLFFGLAFAAFYAFRAAAADWGVFITGVAAGAYRNPVSEMARSSVFWQDLASEIRAGPIGSRTRMVRSRLHVRSRGAAIFGARPVEVHRGTAFFRWWQFYPGPPHGGTQ